MTNETKQPDLNASNLKAALWDTLNGLKDGAVQPGQGDAIAAQAREILRTTNTQLRISQQSKRPVPYGNHALWDYMASEVEAYSTIAVQLVRKYLLLILQLVIIWKE